MKIAILSSILFIAGCQTVSAPPKSPQVVDTACAWDKPISIYTSEVLKLSDDLVAQILAHDREWRKNCVTK